MATVQNLIDQLNKIENKEQSVIFQYFLAEHFEFEDIGAPTEEQFDEATEDLNHSSLWDESAETINDYLYGVMTKNEEEEEEEQEEE
jgi:hypothetical protein